MSYQKWITLLFAYLIIGIATIAGINYIIDPYQQFRISQWYPIHFDSTKQRHLNPGLAKNHEYQSIILGTSHTQNIKIKEVETELAFKKTIKFSMSGASAYEEGKLLKFVLQHNDSINVLYGLDIFSFAGEPTRKRVSFPEYLYEDNTINSIIYLTRLETIIGSLLALATPFIEKEKRKFMFDTMYETEYLNTKKHGKDKMLKHNNINYISTRKGSFEKLKVNFKHNIFPLIINNKTANFIIFYPPYSILSYQHYNNAGLLNNVLLFKKYLFETLKNRGNVKIFDFQIAKEITHNLNNYSDYTHYNQAVSTWILGKIKINNYLVSQNTVNSYEVELIKQVENFKLENSTTMD